MHCRPRRDQPATRLASCSEEEQQAARCKPRAAFGDADLEGARHGGGAGDEQRRGRHLNAEDAPHVCVVHAREHAGEPIRTGHKHAQLHIARAGVRQTLQEWHTGDAPWPRRRPAASGSSPWRASSRTSAQSRGAGPRPSSTPAERSLSSAASRLHQAGRFFNAPRQGTRGAQRRRWPSWRWSPQRQCQQRPRSRRAG